MRTIVAILLFSLAMFMAPSAAGDKSVQVLSGTYDWKDGGSGPLSAEFSPTKDGSWKVRFVFQFSGKPRKWKGTATGSLKDGGAISGTAGWKGRTWVFEAAVEDGVLKGSHTEIQSDGERYNTGTFEMRP